jgi:DNA-binding response OmpR family regulator
MLRVLVVDDSPDTAETTEALLAMWGHEASVAHDGAAAVHMADESRPDVILLDLGMPGMDGHEVARRVRQLAGKRPVIVCVSGHGHDDDRRKAWEAGCDYYFLKPADPEELQRLLRALESKKPPAA